MVNVIESTFPTENRPGILPYGRRRRTFPEEGEGSSCSGKLKPLCLGWVFPHQNQMCKCVWAPPPRHRVTKPGRGDVASRRLFFELDACDPLVEAGGGGPVAGSTLASLPVPSSVLSGLLIV